MDHPADDELPAEAAVGVAVLAQVDKNGVSAEVRLYGQTFHPDIVDSLARRVGDIVSRQIREARQAELSEEEREDDEDEAREGEWADIVCRLEDDKT